MTRRTSLLTRLLSIGPLLLVYGFEKLIERKVGRATFLDPEGFSWIRDLEAQVPRIQHELTRVLQGETYIPEFQEVSIELAKNITEGVSWKTFMFWAYGHRDRINCDRCPETAKLLERIPGLETAFFSILAPDTRITPHRGPFKGVLRYHLALVVPSSDPEVCGITVGGETRPWETGRSLVFDDTHVHQAWNESGEPRVVLFVDFLRELPQPLDTINRFIARSISRSPFIKVALENLEDVRRRNAVEAASSTPQA